MREIFAKLGIEDWPALYSEEDVDRCFEKYVR